MNILLLKFKMSQGWQALRFFMNGVKDDCRGVAAIEFAVIVPTLITMTVCTVDLGMGIYRNMQVQDAAQAGAQYAMFHTFDANLISNAVTNATASTSVSASPAPIQYCGCAATTGVTSIACGSTCSGGAIYGNYVQVSAQNVYTTILPYPLIANSFTLTAQSNVRVQ